MGKRYLRNENMLSREENLILRHKKVAVAGCGGLGGYITEMLARLGVGYITAIDGDRFDETNLNRQLLSNTSNIGQSKAQAACERIRLVNPETKIVCHHEIICEQNAHTLFTGHDVICDALDNINTRFLLQEVAEDLKIPLVFGAIAGWYGQVATIFPGDRLLDRIYKNRGQRGIEKELGNPSFTPALVAAMQVSDVVKILTNKAGLLRHKLLTINTLEHEYEVLNFESAKAES
jgi:molybdopterin/thiamine biosynthesis adenylyltransferase